MASTSATMQTHNDTNLQGRVLLTGNSQAPLLTALGGLAGNVRQVNADQYVMGNSISLDAGSQDIVSETDTLSAGTAKFYAKTQEFNVTQIHKHDFAVSSKRMASPQTIDVTNLGIGELAPTTPNEFDRAAANALQQLQINVEFSLIQGTYVARSAVGTDQATAGLLDPGATMGISTNSVNASSQEFAPVMLSDLMQTMKGNGAPLQMPVILCPYNFVPVISDNYGFQPQDWNIGGIAIKQVVTDFGTMGVIGTAQMLANTIVVTDLAYLALVMQPHADGGLVKMTEYTDGSSAKKGWIEAFVGCDYAAESYHGKIHTLATPTFS